MRGRRKANSDYGESLTVAVELLNSLLKMYGTCAGLQLKGCNPGFFDFYVNDNRYAKTIPAMPNHYTT